MTHPIPIHRLLVPALMCVAAPPLCAQEVVSASAEGVNINLVNVDLRSAVQLLSLYVDRPVFFGAVGDHRITFVSPRPVARGDVPGLLRSLVQQHGYVMEEVEGGAYQVRSTAPAAAAQPQAPPFAQQPQPGAGGPSLASANGMELFVIRLRHARAADVAATVNALYGRAGAVGEIGQRRGTLNDDLNANRVAPYGQEGPQVSGAAGGGGNLRGDVVIVPDFRTNTLLVRASRPDYELIRAAVEQVDVRPLQVLIEATVAYVRRDFRFSYGVEASTGDVAIEGSANSTVGGGILAAGETAADLVIRALNLGGIDLNLILSAGESRSNVIILDRPLLLAANNQEAEIVVGEQRPFTQVQRSTDGGVLDEVVQYKDVGTSLRVLPTISADGFVQLEVTQEVNSASGSAAGPGRAHHQHPFRHHGAAGARRAHGRAGGAGQQPARPHQRGGSVPFRHPAHRRHLREQGAPERRVRAVRLHHPACDLRGRGHGRRRAGDARPPQHAPRHGQGAPPAPRRPARRCHAGTRAAGGSERARHAAAAARAAAVAQPPVGSPSHGAAAESQNSCRTPPRRALRPGAESRGGCRIRQRRAGRQNRIHVPDLVLRARRRVARPGEPGTGTARSPGQTSPRAR